jgi:hypothetical protein
MSYPLPPHWAMLYPSELCCTLLNYAASYEKCTSLNYAVTTVLRCALLSYTAPLYELAHPNWATLHPTELYWTLLNWTLLSYAVPYWATLYSIELRSTIRHYKICSILFIDFEKHVCCILLLSLSECKSNLCKATGIPGFDRGGPCRGWHRTGEPEHLTQSLSPSSSLEFFFKKCVQRKFCSASRRYSCTTSNKTLKLKTCGHKLFFQKRLLKSTSVLLQQYLVKVG